MIHVDVLDASWVTQVLYRSAVVTLEAEQAINVDFCFQNKEKIRYIFVIKMRVNHKKYVFL